MGLESGNFVLDLDENNPLGGDFKSQGDNHLRLVKHCLRTTFPNATREFRFPTSVAKAINYNVLASDQNSTIVVDTTAGAITLVLPTLGVGDYGWCVSIIKSTANANPIFIQAVSGNVTSGSAVVAKARRSVPGAPFQVMWENGVWWIERIIRNPVGSIIQLTAGMALPVGYEFASGQALAAASYPEYAALVGSTAPDLREKIISCNTNGGATIGLINAGRCGFAPTASGFAGGADGVQIAQGHLPNVNFGGSSSGSFSGSGSGSISGGTDFVGDHQHSFNDPLQGGSRAFDTTVVSNMGNPGLTSPAGGHSHSVSGSCSVNVSGSYSGSATVNSGGSSVFLTNMPPTYMCNFAVVVE